MATIADYYQYSQLATASYINLDDYTVMKKGTDLFFSLVRK